MSIAIRIAKAGDLQEITSILRDTIRHVNSKDYNPLQIAVWSGAADDTERWLKRINDYYFIVAEQNDRVVGFAYLSAANYFGGLFVDKDLQGKGIATRLLNDIEDKAKDNGYDIIESDVSITALPFFEKHGYTVERKQRKLVKGMVFENFIVSKEI
ncbi:MAG: GNAT family N-acetyltransferase [Bacteroidia bacterium]|nr:GNAT family N-acetyltransferase [Bacteroidia bacterium]